MQNDLISRSAFIEFVKNLPKTENGYSSEYDENEILHYINEQPTAYDVEKVVEQLDEYITKIVGRGSGLYQTVMHIVRKGGVE